MIKNRLTRKLLFYIVLCSSVFTLLATAFQLYMDYRRDLAAVHESIQFIEKSYLKTLAASAYDMDEEQIRLQLQGALKLRDVEYLEIIETRTNGEVVVAAQGNPNAKKDIVRDFTLEYTNAPDGTLQTGKLRVTASLEGVYQRLWSKALIVLVSNAGKALVASFFIFLIIQFLITRHIARMAKYTQELDIDKLDQELLLDRRTNKSSKPDELDQLATAFNNMRVRIFESIEDRKQAEERIKRLNSILMAIRNVNQIIAVEKDRDSLLQKTCNILTEARGYDAAWLGFSPDSKTFVAVKSAGFREDISRFSEHVIGGDYPPCIKRSIAEKQKLVIVDKPGECEDCFFKDAHADKDVAIIRVEHAGRFYGLLAILFAPDFPADEEEKELLKEVADDIGTALRGIALEEALVKSEQRLADIINFLPDATFAIDLDGKVIAWNHAIEEMTGVKDKDIIGKGNYEYALPFYGTRRPILIDLVFKPDSEIEEKYSFVHREGNTLLAEAGVPFLNKPGLFLWGKASPMYDHKGNVTGAVESIRDISARKETEKELKEASDIVNRSPAVAFLWKNEEGWPVEFVTDNVKKLFGYTEWEFTSGSVSYAKTIHPDDLKRVAEEVISYSEDKERKEFVHEPYRIVTKDGEVKWIEDRTFIGRDESGRITHYRGIVIDITSRKEADEKVQNSLREKEVLLSEIHHRVKNNMQLVSSLLNLQAGHIEDERALELFKESQSRVRTMALIHDRLYQAKDLASIDFAVYIRNLMGNLLSIYGIDTGIIKLNIYAKDVFLDINKAIPCGLIINELVSNAFKHAFPDGKEGEVSITLTEDKVEKKYTLIVSDDGVSFPKGLDFRDTETLGMRLVNILTKQLHGVIELDRSSGTSFKIVWIV